MELRFISVVFQSTLPRGRDVQVITLLIPTLNFNPRSLAGATISLTCAVVNTLDFNPRSLAGATNGQQLPYRYSLISIHAPSRERRYVLAYFCIFRYFNPRSLAGATLCLGLYLRSKKNISIHAPSRERLEFTRCIGIPCRFQSTLPRGSDPGAVNRGYGVTISIHAPSRERQN